MTVRAMKIASLLVVGSTACASGNAVTIVNEGPVPTRVEVAVSDGSAVWVIDGGFGPIAVGELRIASGASRTLLVKPQTEASLRMTVTPDHRAAVTHGTIGYFSRGASDYDHLRLRLGADGIVKP